MKMLGKNHSISMSTTIDPSARLEGKFSSQADLVISGQIEGTVESTKNIKIEESSSIKAELKAQNIVVSGKVEGNIEAMEDMEITKTGKIIGDIKCKVLNIEQGAKLDGKCIMPTEKSPIEKEKPFKKEKAKSQVKEHTGEENPGTPTKVLSPNSNQINSMTKTCLQCGGQMQYVSEYQRWYCDKCGKYEKPGNEENHEQTKDKDKEAETEEEKEEEGRNSHLKIIDVFAKNKKKKKKGR